MGISGSLIQQFYFNEFKRLLNDDLNIEYNDFIALMKYMLEKKYILSYQDSVEAPRYFLVAANLIDFVENLPSL